MYIAMNRFHVNAGREEVFEEIWRKRDSYLHEVPGFNCRLVTTSTILPPGPTGEPYMRSCFPQSSTRGQPDRNPPTVS